MLENGKAEPGKQEISANVLRRLGREPGVFYNEDEEYSKSKPFFWKVWKNDGETREVTSPSTAVQCSLSKPIGPFRI